jgi:hypothetical protein
MKRIQEPDKHEEIIMCLERLSEIHDVLLKISMNLYTWRDDEGNRIFSGEDLTASDFHFIFENLTMSCNLISSFISSVKRLKMKNGETFKKEIESNNNIISSHDNIIKRFVGKGK